MQTHEPARGPHVLRQINLAAVLRAVRDRSPARVADLMQETGLSRPAVTRAVADLREAGLLVDLPDAASDGMGRPAQRVRFRAEVGHVVGVDVGSHTTRAKVADLSGAVLASRSALLRQPASGRDLLAALDDTVRGVLADASLTPDDVWAVAVGAPGVVDAGRGEVLLAPGIPGWEHQSVPDHLRGTFACPVLLENDTNLAVQAERWCGAAQSDSVVFVHWGTRVGVGIVLDGRPYRGASGAAGELGFVDVFTAADREGAPEPEDLVHPEQRLRARLGAFEDAVGAQAILDLAAQREVRAPGAVAPRGVEDVFAAAAAGDGDALAVVDAVAYRFARGLAALLLVLDPAEVVIGGGVSQAGEPLLRAIERHLRPRVLTSPRVLLSGLGGDAVAMGAIRAALDHVEPRLLAHGPEAAPRPAPVARS